MEAFEYWERLKPLFKSNFLALLLGVLGLIFLISGLFSLFFSSKEEIVFDTSETTSAESQEKIAVDVSGAVIKPGLYTFEDGARIQDALAAAGGLSDEADREWIEKSLNLALRLQDGVKIYIPRVNEEGSVQGTSEAVSSLININSASSKELESLPGIGPVTAGKIIDARPYSSIEDLLAKKAVSTKVFEQIKDKISAF